MLFHSLWLWEWEALHLSTHIPPKLFIEEKIISADP